MRQGLRSAYRPGSIKYPVSLIERLGRNLIDNTIYDKRAHRGLIDCDHY